MATYAATMHATMSHTDQWTLDAMPLPPTGRDARGCFADMPGRVCQSQLDGCYPNLEQLVLHHQSTPATMATAGWPSLAELEATRERLLLPDPSDKRLEAIAEAPGVSDESRAKARQALDAQRRARRELLEKVQRMIALQKRAGEPGKERPARASSDPAHRIEEVRRLQEAHALAERKREAIQAVSDLLHGRPLSAPLTLDLVSTAAEAMSMDVEALLELLSNANAQRARTPPRPAEQPPAGMSVERARQLLLDARSIREQVSRLLAVRDSAARQGIELDPNDVEELSRAEKLLERVQLLEANALHVLRSHEDRETDDDEQQQAYSDDFVDEDESDQEEPEQREQEDALDQGRRGLWALHRVLLDASKETVGGASSEKLEGLLGALQGSAGGFLSPQAVSEALVSVLLPPGDVRDRVLAELTEPQGSDSHGREGDADHDDDDDGPQEAVATPQQDEDAESSDSSSFVSVKIPCSLQIVHRDVLDLLRRGHGALQVLSKVVQLLRRTPRRVLGDSRCAACVEEALSAAITSLANDDVEGWTGETLFHRGEGSDDSGGSSVGSGAPHPPVVVASSCGVRVGVTCQDSAPSLWTDEEDVSANGPGKSQLEDDIQSALASVVASTKGSKVASPPSRVVVSSHDEFSGWDTQGGASTDAVTGSPLKPTCRPRPPASSPNSQSQLRAMREQKTPALHVEDLESSPDLVEQMLSRVMAVLLPCLRGMDQVSPATLTNLAQASATAALTPEAHRLLERQSSRQHWSSSSSPSAMRRLVGEFRSAIDGWFQSAATDASPSESLGAAMQETIRRVVTEAHHRREEAAALQAKLGTVTKAVGASVPRTVGASAPRAMGAIVPVAAPAERLGWIEDEGYDRDDETDDEPQEDLPPQKRPPITQWGQPDELPAFQPAGADDDVADREVRSKALSLSSLSGGDEDVEREAFAGMAQWEALERSDAMDATNTAESLANSFASVIARAGTDHRSRLEHLLDRLDDESDGQEEESDDPEPVQSRVRIPWAEVQGPEWATALGHAADAGVRPSDTDHLNRAGASLLRSELERGGGSGRLGQLFEQARSLAKGDGRLRV
jgi:hypothetical protein